MALVRRLSFTIAGVVLLSVGLVATVIYGIGLLDPAGTKMADDGDPFGPPPPWQFGAVGLLVSLAVAGAGCYLAYMGRPRIQPRSGGHQS